MKLYIYSSEMGGFNGNIRHASELLARLGDGINCIKNFFATKVEVEYPDIWIMHGEGDPKPPIFDHTSPDKLTTGTVIKKSFLEEASIYELEDIRPFYSRGKLVLRASTSDLFFLAGVEETHHAVFRQINPSYTENGIDRTQLSSAEYNALENEWQALHFKIKFSEERGIADSVIARLLEIRKEAKSVREQQGLPAYPVPYLG